MDSTLGKLKARAATLGVLAALLGSYWWIWSSWWDNPNQAFFERHRPVAEAYCQVEPEMKFRKYPLADGTDPAPDLDAFEYCVSAYISHLPGG